MNLFELAYEQGLLKLPNRGSGFLVPASAAVTLPNKALLTVSMTNWANSTMEPKDFMFMGWLLATADQEGIVLKDKVDEYRKLLVRPDTETVTGQLERVAISVTVRYSREGVERESTTHTIWVAQFEELDRANTDPTTPDWLREDQAIWIHQWFLTMFMQAQGGGPKRPRLKRSPGKAARKTG